MKKTFKAILRTDLHMKGKKRRIDILIYFGGKQTKFPTSCLIESEYWDKVSEKVLNASPSHQFINNFISSKRVAFNKYINQKEVLDDCADIFDIKAIISGKPIENIKNDQLPIGELFDMYIEDLKNRRRRRNTIRNFLSAKKITCDFAKQYCKKDQTIGKIDFQFLMNFSEYLSKGRSNNDNSVNKRVINLRTVVNFAIDLKYPIEYPFKRFVFKPSTSRDTYLNFDEYEKFKELEIPPYEVRGMRLSKTLFIFSCETGLRWGDVADLKWSNIIDNFKAISIVQNKTSKNVYIPISNDAKMILNRMKKYSKSELVFEKITNKSVNENLKKIAIMLGIEKNITFHVARHTCASLLSLKGVSSPMLIMKFLGDSDARQAKTYINMDNDDFDKQMRKFI